MTTGLDNVQACVFDAYGTLFDFGSAAAQCRAVLGDRAAPLTTLWRDKQLQYTWLRGLQDRHADFWQVTGDALDFAMESLQIVDRDLRDRLMELYLTLDAFPEVTATLRAVKDAGRVNAILSNGTPRMLAAAIAMPSSTISSTWSSQWRMQVSTSRIQRSTALLSSDWASRPIEFASCRRMPGTPLPRRPSACASFGAIATRNARRGCQACRTLS